MELDFEFSAETKEFAKAMVAAQSKITGAVKSASNPHLNKSYADLASVWDAIREPFTSNGLAVIQMPIGAPGGVFIVTTVLHVSGQFCRSKLFIPVSKEDAQGYGSATTYGRRYALAAHAGVAPEEDDGHAAAKAAPIKEARPLASTVAKVQAAFPGSTISPRIGDGSGVFKYKPPFSLKDTCKARGGRWSPATKTWDFETPQRDWEQYSADPVQKTAQEVMGDDQPPEPSKQIEIGAEEQPPPFDDKDIPF